MVRSANYGQSYTKVISALSQADIQTVALRRLWLPACRRFFSSSIAAEQKSQDHDTGEMDASLRRYIENVECEMHKIQIWGARQLRPER
jgi:hypothetical protein